ncbi:MAG: DUF2069 domain-containing protein [Pusillimonas sp.]
MKPPELNPVLRFGAIFSLVGLIVLTLVWELVVAPWRPELSALVGVSWLVFKLIPLLLPLPGVIKGRLYTLQWASMLVLLYFMEGVVRAFSDSSPVSRLMASIEIGLAVVFYLCAILYVRPAKKAAKAAKSPHATLSSQTIRGENGR